MGESDRNAEACARGNTQVMGKTNGVYNGKQMFPNNINEFLKIQLTVVNIPSYMNKNS